MTLAELARRKYTRIDRGPVTHKVFVEYDGCPDEEPYTAGTYDDCIAFIEKTRPPKNCSWLIVSVETGRAVSYVFRPRYTLQARR